MKNLKRVLALVTVLSMLMSVSAFAADYYVDEAFTETELESTYNYAELNAAVDATNATDEADTIHVAEGNYELAATATLEEGLTITGEGKEETTVTITTNNGDGLKITNEDVTISNMHIDGSNITSGGYKSLVNVEADGATISSVSMTGGGMSTWNSSILVEKLTNEETFTLEDSDVTGSFRGILRESCDGNIVIDNSDIDAIYPFNIDGGSDDTAKQGKVTVTDSELHGWTSYSSVDSVTFTNTEFSKGNSGYDVVAAYSDTTFDNCTFDENFNLYVQTTGFEWTIKDTVKDGTLITDNSEDALKGLGFTDSWLWDEEKTTVTVINTPYTVTYVDEDGTQLDSQTYLKRQTVEASSLIPVKASDGVYTYEFAGWSETTDEDGNVTYTAIYTATEIPAADDFIPDYDFSDDSDTTSDDSVVETPAPVTIEEGATPLAALPEDFTVTEEQATELAVDLGIVEAIEEYVPETVAEHSAVAAVVESLTAGDDNADAAAILAEAGINEGDEVSREQFATVIFALATAQGYDVTARADLSEKFTDAEAVSAFAQEALAWAVEAGIYQGVDVDLLDPQGMLTYEQLILVVSRYLAMISAQ